MSSGLCSGGNGRSKERIYAPLNYEPVAQGVEDANEIIETDVEVGAEE